MRMQLFLAILLVTVLVPWCSGLGVPEALEMCKNMEHPRHGLFTPFMCSYNRSRLGEVGAQFREEHKIKDTDLDPVVLIPGLGGSGLEANLNRDSRPAWFCFRSADWYRIWFSLEEILMKTCWLENLQISYDPVTDTYNNSLGVSIRAIDFGGVSGVDYLDFEFGLPISATGVFAPLIQSLLKVGYTAGVDLRGAPYDWRVPAYSEQKLGYFQQLQQLIEETYTTNGNRSVHIVTHSLGGPTTLYFLNLMTQAWKDQYVKSFIPIAGPWAGAAAALRAVISGDNFGISVYNYNLVSNLELRAVSREAGGIVELMPSPDVWPASTVFVTTNKRNYTISDFTTLFSDVGTPNTTAVYSGVKDFIGSLKLPNVPTYCLFGHGIPTEIHYTYPDGDFDKDPIIDESDQGDGTVPSFSLDLCTQWGSQQSQPVAYKEFDGQTHVSILSADQVLAYVLSIVTDRPI